MSVVQGAMWLSVCCPWTLPFHLVNGDATGFLRVASFGMCERWFCGSWECLGVAYVLTSLLRSFGEGSPSVCLFPSLPTFLSLPLLPSLSLHLSLLSGPHDVLLPRASVCRPLEMLKKTSECYGGRHRNRSKELSFSWEGCFFANMGAWRSPPRLRELS